MVAYDVGYLFCLMCRIPWHLRDPITSGQNVANKNVIAVTLSAAPQGHIVKSLLPRLGNSLRSSRSSLLVFYTSLTELASGERVRMCGWWQNGSSRRVRVSIAPNPSHLEAVAPVVLGMVRAEQTRRILKGRQGRSSAGASNGGAKRYN